MFYKFFNSNRRKLFFRHLRLKALYRLNIMGQIDRLNRLRDRYHGNDHVLFNLSDEELIGLSLSHYIHYYEELIKKRDNERID